MARKSYYDMGVEAGYNGGRDTPPEEAGVRGREQFNKGFCEGEAMRLARRARARAKGEA